MYPIKLSFGKVLLRIRKLKQHHPAEALVTSMFTFEKLMKRSLRRSMVARGLTIARAEKLIGRKGFDDLADMWPVFSYKHETLPVILANHWPKVMEAKKMRNDFVHGNGVYDKQDCNDSADELLAALEKLHDYGLETFGSDPWTKRPRKKTMLSWEP